MAWPEALDVSAPASGAGLRYRMRSSRSARDATSRSASTASCRAGSPRERFARVLAAVHTLLVSEAPTATEALDAHLARLPPRRHAAERRFAPAATLQADGALDRERIVKFLDECAALVVSDATVDELSAAPRRGRGAPPPPAARIHGAHGHRPQSRRQPDGPKALVKKYPGDGAMLGACQRLVHACAHADALARERAQRPAADAAARLAAGGERSRRQAPT